MQCVICKHGKTQSGHTTVTLERQGATLVIKNVPAEVCSNCGEAYFDEHVGESLLRSAEEAVKSGVQVDVREYVAA